jgi:hypothetical protein
VYALFTLNPLFWLMGLGGFIWSMAAFPLAVWMVQRRGLRWPPTVWLFAVYVGWSTFSVVRLDRFTRILVFGMRYAVYLTAIGLAVYVYNERRVTREKFIDWIALFWVWAIIGGYLGLLFPHVRLTKTPASLVLPKAIANDSFVAGLVQPRLAQVQNLFGVSIPRPSTLFEFTNEWGSAVGLLTPFFVAATLYSADPRRRKLGLIGLLVAAPPMILSLNRGLWISVGVIFGVVAVRSFIAGRTGPLKMLGFGIVAIAALIAFTPIGEVVAGRLSESDAGARAGIYAEAWAGAKQSPLIGWGGPRPSTNPFSPSVGTHGHLWFAMFSHGFVGLGLYILWLIAAMYRASRRRDPVSIMLASVIFVGAIQMNFYNMFPVPLPIILISIGLLYRNDELVENASSYTDGSFEAPVVATEHGVPA